MGKLSVPACPLWLPTHPGLRAVLPKLYHLITAVNLIKVHRCHVQPTTEAQARNITHNKCS
jgi:hypothetical protein